ncbi:hypothetical protein BB560_003415 [Smittium megazygosporum]|uniref:CRESS-DNA virus Rep endonuclease domain-containing protein n=1 Tax=Smittium megazygosporum TaxID=133381 RepID=A0A2T9ZC16_9FUNG|nr:hypothetical protein BB560_003415 [Smittium megazygosporum]
MPNTCTEVFDALKDKGLSLVKYVIARELHADKTAHIHVYFKSHKKLSVKKSNYFDILKRHGNYQTCRSPAHVIRYVTKGNKFITNMTDRELSIKPKSVPELIMEQNDLNAAIDLVKTDAGLRRDFVRNSVLVTRSISRIVNTNIQSSRPSTSRELKFIMPEIVSKWDRSKTCLWLRGRTDTGKTSFAKSLFKKPLIVRLIETLQKLEPSHDGIIFDDMNFSGFGKEAQIHLLDLENDSDINVKHNFANIPWGLPRVFTSNGPIFSNFPEIRRRIHFCKVSDDLRILSEADKTTLQQLSKYNPTEHEML